MKKYLYFVFLYSCIEVAPAKIYSNAYFLKLWQQQYTSWGYQAEDCCYLSDSNLFADWKNISTKSEINIAAINLSSKYAHCGYETPLILRYKHDYFLWGGAEFFEPLFWKRKNQVSSDTLTICRQELQISNNFDTYYFALRRWDEPQEMQNIYNSQHNMHAFNTYIYAESNNSQGNSFDITHFAQFEQLNDLLAANPKFWNAINLAVIDTFLYALHNNKYAVADGDAIPYTYLQINTNTSRFFELNKSKVDTQKIQKRGLDFVNKNLLYFDGVLTAKANDITINYLADKYKFPKNYYKNADIYLAPKLKIDSLDALKQYLETNTPSLLYYKANGHAQSPWYNYFIAYHIAYTEKGQPRIEKVSLICPQRIYFYLCYPYKICAGMGDRKLRDS